MGVGAPTPSPHLNPNPTRSLSILRYTLTKDVTYLVCHLKKRIELS